MTLFFYKRDDVIYTNDGEYNYMKIGDGPWEQFHKYMYSFDLIQCSPSYTVYTPTPEEMNQLKVKRFLS